MESLSERIKRAAKDRGVTLKAASGLAEIPYRSFQKYASGEQEPGAAAIVKICSALGVSADWLLTGVDGADEANNKAPEHLPGTLKPLNEALLRTIIEVVEGMLTERRAVLPPARKAELVVVLYEHFAQEEQEVARPVVERFLRLVS